MLTTTIACGSSGTASVAISPQMRAHPPAGMRRVEG